MVASAMSQKTVQECLDEYIQCDYLLPPTAVCGRNKDGIEHRFIGSCEFSYVNSCVQPEGIDFSHIFLEFIKLIFLKNISRCF